jgi:signal recognition particle receptor subunit beta
MNVVLGPQAPLQVVFVGPFGVGKTTALRSVSDIPVVSTEELSLESSGQKDKTTTTVGFDYGEWNFPGDMRVRLMGMPGQERFSAMWDVLLPESSAVVLWLYGDRPDALVNCHFWLDELARRRAVSRLAVALTRLPADVPWERLEPFRQLTGFYHPLAPVITADPRDPGSVIQAIVMALSTPPPPALKTARLAG